MTRQTALIIEDYPELAHIFSTAFQRARYDVRIALDGSEALNCLQTQPFDIVVLDLHLPQVSGDDLLHYIRESEHTAHTRVIIVSADPHMAARLQDQAELVLVKPVTYSEMRDVAEELRDYD